MSQTAARVDPAALSDARDAPHTVVRACTSHETRRDIAHERIARLWRERGRVRATEGARRSLARG